MSSPPLRSMVVCLVAATAFSIGPAPSRAEAQDPPPSRVFNDVPTDFKSKAPKRDYDVRIVMIPMRDGVKLQTFMLSPRAPRMLPS